MIRCRLAVCAQSTVRDAESNQVSIFNILEDVWASSFPLVFPSVHAVFMLTREDGDPGQPDFRLRVSQGRHGEDVVPINVNFEDKRRTRALVRLEGLPIRAVGLVRFAILLDDQELGVWEIEAHQLEVSPPRVRTAPG